MKKMLLAIALLCTSMTNNALAEAKQHEPNQLKVIAAPAPSVADTTSDKIKIEILKAQNELIKENQDRIISTVYLALSGIFTIAAVLAGVGWWSNFKLYENDKKRLQEELLSQLKESESRTSLKLESAKSELERDIYARTVNQLEKISTENNDIKIKINNLENRTKRTDEVIEEKTKKMQSEITTTNAEILSLHVDITELEAHIWEVKQVHSNTLLTRLQTLRAAYEADSPWIIDSTIPKIHKLIKEEFIDKGKGISEGMLAVMGKQISKIIAHNEEVGNKISEELRQVTALKPEKD